MSNPQSSIDLAGGGIRGGVVTERSIDLIRLESNRILSWNDTTRGRSAAHRQWLVNKEEEL